MKIFRLARSALISSAVILLFFGLGNISYGKQIDKTLTSSQNMGNNNNFSFKLFKQVSKDQADKNIFISPAGIASVGSMIWFGSAGKTKDELTKLLFNGDDVQPASVCDSYISTNQVLNQNNDINEVFDKSDSIWVNNGFKLKSSYINQMKKCFNSEVKSINFADKRKAVNIINDFVSLKTHKMIHKLITTDDIKPQTKLALLNTIYFKGNWQYPFEKSHNRKLPFYPSNLSNKNFKKITMMALSGEKHLPYTENKDWQVLALPYKGNNTSMIVFLPKPGKSLSSLIQKEDSSNLMKLVNNLRSTAPDEIDLKFPKFSLDQSLNVKNIFRQMGVNLVFLPLESDLSNIADLPKGRLYVGLFKQKAKIEVTEEGTKAAAVTVAVMNLTSVANPHKPKIIHFDANHPFMFMIIDNDNKQILFMGRYSKPVGFPSDTE